MNESTKNGHKQQLLTLLLTKYESSPDGASVFLTMADPIWLELYREPKVRERIHAAIRQLETDGLANVLWAWSRDGFEVSKVYLNLKKLDLAYEQSGIDPRSQQLSELKEILSPLESHPWVFVKQWWKQTQELISQGKTPSLGQDNAEVYADLVKALQALAILNRPQEVRDFSQTVYGSPLHFEQRVKDPFVKLIQSASPECYRSEQEVLDSCNLYTTPVFVLLAGHLLFAINCVAYNLCLFPHGIGLPLAAVSSLDITHISAKRVITVESLDIYHSLAKELDKQRDLLVYTGGYPNCGTRILLDKLVRHIAESNSLLEIYHHGSIGYFGIRVFEYMRRNHFPSLIPLSMDCETYEAQIVNGTAMSEKEATKLDYLLQDYEYSQWQPLLASMLRNRVAVSRPVTISNGALV